jgi:hypothetical protein
MAFTNSSTINVTQLALSRIYNERQEIYLRCMPKTIGDRTDIYNVKTTTRDKPKGASKLYSAIKDKFLLQLDTYVEEFLKDTDTLNKKIVEYIHGDNSKKIVKKTLKNVKQSKENVHDFVILYDEFTWFKDPNLLSTIRIHEKLNEVFLSQTEKGLNKKIEETKIKDSVKQIATHPKYIKAIMVITFQPILTYGALYASLMHDYEYIIEYERLVSEAAEEIFKNSPNIKSQFFQLSFT